MTLIWTWSGKHDSHTYNLFFPSVCASSSTFLEGENFNFLSTSYSLSLPTYKKLSNKVIYIQTLNFPNIVWMKAWRNRFCLTFDVFNVFFRNHGYILETIDLNLNVNQMFFKTPLTLATLSSSCADPGLRVEFTCVLVAEYFDIYELRIRYV